jgi:hypothetical protein
MTIWSFNYHIEFENKECENLAINGYVLLVQRHDFFLLYVQNYGNYCTIILLNIH